MEIDVQHEPERRRFVAPVEGREAVLDYAEGPAGTLDYRHTFVPEELRNRGIGEALVAHALEWARENGRRVVPSCPFVAAVVRRRPEFGDVVATGEGPRGPEA